MIRVALNLAVCLPLLAQGVFIPATPQRRQMGSAALSIVELSKDVLFAQPMATTNYSVDATATGSVCIVTNKTTNGFTVLLSIGINGTLNWSATL